MNGSALQAGIVTKVGRSCDFGSIPLPKKSSAVSHEDVPFMQVLPVLAANLSWRNGQPWWRQAQSLFANIADGCSSFHNGPSIGCYTIAGYVVLSMVLSHNQKPIEAPLYSDGRLPPRLAADRSMSQSGKPFWQSTKKASLASVIWYILPFRQKNTDRPTVSTSSPLARLGSIFGLCMSEGLLIRLEHMKIRV